MILNTKNAGYYMPAFDHCGSFQKFVMPFYRLFIAIIAAYYALG